MGSDGAASAHHECAGRFRALRAVHDRVMVGVVFDPIQFAHNGIALTLPRHQHEATLLPLMALAL
jgi:hypothetical protein